MAQLVIPDCYLVSIKGTSGGQPVNNVIGVRAPGNTAISVATAVKGAWKVANGPMSKLPTAYTFSEVTAMYIGSVDGDVYTTSDGTAGTVAQQLSTNGACALITFGNGTRNKSARGRMYFGPMVEGNINTDGRTLANPQQYTDAITAFRTALEVNNRKWVILSRKYSTATDITSIATQSIIATQRRRVR